jgi:hypothetical protein
MIETRIEEMKANLFRLIEDAKSVDTKKNKSAARRIRVELSNISKLCKELRASVLEAVA